MAQISREEYNKRAIAYRKKYAEADPEAWKKLCNERYLKAKAKRIENGTQEAFNAKQKEYIDKNYEVVKERRKLASRRHYQNNRGKRNAKRMSRFKQVSMATPKWLTKDQLQEIYNIYEKCPKGYEVDHCVPIKNNRVCGLHVPWNLKIITVAENRSKGNRWFDLS